MFDDGVKWLTLDCELMQISSCNVESGSQRAANLTKKRQTFSELIIEEVHD